MTLCTAPKVLMTLLPDSRHGAAPRSGRSARFGTLGFWICRAKALATLLSAERDGNAAPADRDDEARPGRRERLVGGDGAEQARGRHVNLQPRRQKRMAPVTRTRFKL